MAIRWIARGLLLIALLMLCYLAYMLLAVRGTFAPFHPATHAGGTAVVAGASGHQIVGRVFVDGAVKANAPLVVLLHGDAPFTNPGYQYEVASDIANAAPGVRVVALMRPGYADAYGARSDGDRGFASGDNYTPDAISDVAAAIVALKQRWLASSVILAGHSGGATMSADIATMNPKLIQHVFLVGCPCDVPAFRQHMAHVQWGPTWLTPVRSVSPLQIVDRMDRSTAITAISGAEDSIALPQYARHYIAKAQASGVSATMITLPGKGHEIFDDSTVIANIAKAAEAGPSSLH